MTAALQCYAQQPEAKKAAAEEAKAVRQAAKAVMAAVQGPRTALLFFKLDCEAALGEAADPEMCIAEVTALLTASYYLLLTTTYYCCLLLLLTTRSPRC